MTDTDIMCCVYCGMFVGTQPGVTAVICDDCEDSFYSDDESFWDYQREV
jgi:hypothetical protein